MSEIHPQYTFLRRHEEKPRHFVVSCNICSYDKFVQAGLCSGEFSSFSGSLKGTPSSSPSKCCRCSDNFGWTKEQREFQIKERLEELGGEWVGWKENIITPTYKEKFRWVCKEGHHVVGDIDNFLRGKSCKVCYKNKPNKMFNGYDPDRKEDNDLLYIIKFKDEYIKCGRAFILEKRLKYTTGLLKKSGCTRDQLEILHVYTGTHQEVYDTEQFVIDELTERGFYYKTWTRETFSIDSEKLMVDLIENHSTLTKVEYVEGM